MKKTIPILIIVLFFSFTELFAQSFNILESYQHDVTIRKIGMAILGIWAIANILTGAIGRSRLQGQNSYFHQMNMIWNFVNIGIAAAGYYFSVYSEVPADAAALLSDQIFFQKTLLFNAGLDLAYITGGFYLIERAKNTKKKPERLKGYGKSIILQGIFLFVFDVLLHTIHVRNTDAISEFTDFLY